VIGNIGNLLSVFRQSKRRVFFTRHGIQLPDAGDLVERRRNREQIALAATGGRSGHLAVKGTPGYEIIGELAPLSDELVLDKNTSSAFHSTPLDLFLRNMHVDTVILTGIASDQCVFATALDAADRGFHVIIAADACANLDPGSAEAVQILFGRVFGYVMQTSAILHWLETGTEPRETRIKA
jgi:nicotinamidase-related amidase